MIDELTNEDRADLAEAAVETFAEAARNDTREEALRDLLVNMLHLCDRYGVSQDEVLEAAQGVYDEEVADEDGVTAEGDFARGNELLKHPKPDAPDKVPAEQLTLGDKVLTSNGMRRVLSLRAATDNPNVLKVEVQDAGSPTGTTDLYYGRTYLVTIAPREE